MSQRHCENPSKDLTDDQEGNEKMQASVLQEAVSLY